MAHNGNVGASPKCLRIIEMSAHYWNVGILWKCWCFIEMSAHYGNVGILWKCRHPMKMLVPYTMVNDTYKNIQQLYKLTILLFGLANSTMTALLSSRWWLSSIPEGVVPSICCRWVLATTSWPAYMCALSLYWPALVVPAKCWCSTQMLALYSNVDAQWKSLKMGSPYLCNQASHQKMVKAKSA